MSIYPTKILLATDGSEEATLAARTAGDLSDRIGSELHVVHVAYLLPMSSEASYMASQLYREAYEDLKQKAQELLDEQVRKIKGAGGRVAQAHLKIGRPDAEIVALAEELGVDLIVVGSRGRGGIRRALMGGVSDSVVRHAHCPVLVVREEEAVNIFPTKILLATDGSEDATLAARAATDIANKTGSELHVVLVGLPPGYIGTGEPLVTDILVPSQEELKEINDEFQRLLDAQVKQIKAAGGTVTQAHLEIGKPDEEIIALGEEIDARLIAVGSRGLGGLERALMGSISDSVVHHAHCSVLVVRRENQRATGSGQ